MLRSKRIASGQSLLCALNKIMCLLKSFCCCFDLQLGVKVTSVLGIVITLVYIVMLLFGGRDVFVFLSFYHINYVYIGILMLVVNFFVHLLLWSGATKKRKNDLIPWLIFITIKNVIMVSASVKMLLNVTSPDPSVWTDPQNCIDLCKNITETARTGLDPITESNFRPCLSGGCLNATMTLKVEHDVTWDDFVSGCLSLNDPDANDAHDPRSNSPMSVYGDCLNTVLTGKMNARISSTVYAFLFVAAHLYFWMVVFSFFMKLDRSSQHHTFV